MTARGRFVKDVDRGYAALVKRAKLHSKLSVGVHASAGQAQKETREGEVEAKHDGITVAQVAEWLEFGTATQVPRPFIRAFFDENPELIREAISRMARQVLEGRITREVALERLGLFFVGKIQAKLAAGLQPPNRPATLARKGPDAKAGVDTGQLRSSITHEVHE